MENRPKTPKGNDPYSRVNYRRVVAWPARIRREAPFLRENLKHAPERSVLDLGCGTGEHCRFLVDEGFQVVGLDRSESMIGQAEEKPLRAELRFILGEIQELKQKVKDTFGAAICLGNTLVHLVGEEDLKRSFAGLIRVLKDGGIFLFQILNYERIFEKNVRYLPLNFRPGDEGEIVFLRLMEHLGDGRVRFCPSTLKYDAEADPPLQVVKSRIVDLRGWKRADLLPLLEQAGFGIVGVHGDMEGSPFDPHNSHDLVVIARKSSHNTGRVDDFVVAAENS